MTLTPSEDAAVAIITPEPVRRLIRYSNRKIYDPVRHCYVNFRELMDLVNEGDPFEVKRSKTGENITPHILAGIIGHMAREGVSIDCHELLMFMRRCQIAHDARAKEPIAQAEGQPS